MSHETTDDILRKHTRHYLYICHFLSDMCKYETCISEGKWT